MSLLYIVCFDVSDKKRLRKVSNEIENFGVRVQHSVFECHLDERDVQQLQKRLEALIAHEQDRVHYFCLCAKDEKRIQIDGDQYQSQNVDYYLQ